MSESSLSLAYSNIATAVAQFLGWNTTLSSLSTAETNAVYRAIDSGYRRVITAVDPRTGKKHRWSWLFTSSTIVTTADDSTYDLPDDFGSMAGDIYYPADEGRDPLRNVGYAKVLELLAQSDTDGYPEVYCIRWDKSFDGTAGQRAQITLYPTPDSAWTFVYRYKVLVPENIRSATAYPRGGMEHAELFRQAAVAAADLQENDNLGAQEQMYKEMLIQSIESDKENYPDVIGYNGDGSQDGTRSLSYYGQYNGVTPTW